MDNSTDEKLLAAAQGGDAVAEAALLVQYKPLVNSIARRYFLVGGDEEDLVQEGMIGLYYAVRTYSADKGAAFTTYAAMCIRNRIADIVRGAQRDKNKALNDSVPIVRYNAETDELFYVEIEDAEGDPAEQLIKREAGQEFMDRIRAAVTPKEYDILVKYLAGQSYSSIAAELGTAPKTVDNALQSAKRKIRKILGK